MVKRYIALTCLLILPAHAGAAETLKDGLALVPDSAVGFLHIPSIKKIETGLQHKVTELGLEAFVPPGKLSLKELLQQHLGISEGLDENGSLTIAMLTPPKPPATEGAPAMPSMGFDVKPAFIVPATDAKMLLESMGAQAGEGGLWTATVQGSPFFCMIKGKQVIASPSADIVKEVATNQSSIFTKLKPQDQKALGDLDLAIWIDGDRLFKQLKPQIDGIVGMAMMMQAAGNPMAMKQAEGAKKQLDIFMDGTNSLTLGLSVGPRGLGLRFFVTGKPGTDFAKKMKMARTTSTSLLKGLPAEKFMLAAGQTIHPDATKEMFEYIEPYLEMGTAAVSEANKQHVTQIKDLVEEFAMLVTGMRCSISALPPGPDGLVGVAAILEVSDSAKSMELLGKIIETVKKLDPGEDEEAKQTQQAIIHKPGAEEIDGVKVMHLGIDLTKIEELEEEDELEDITAVIGQDGCLFRLAAVDSKTLLIGFGGGSQRMKQLVTLARKGDAPLENDVGIRKFADRVPKEKVGVFYAAVDQIVSCIRNGQKALEEEQLPVEMPMIDAPLVAISTGGQDWAQVDLFLPTELMVASKDFIMAMMGTGGPAVAPGAEVQGAAPATGTTNE